MLSGGLTPAYTHTPPLARAACPEQGNSYLRVAPLTVHGAPARGAIVRLTGDDGRTQMRLIDAGSGYLCQMEPQRGQSGVLAAPWRAATGSSGCI